MVEAGRDEETTTGRYHRSADGRLIGLLLIGLGVAWFLSEIGGLSGETVRAALLTLLGAGLIYTARRGRGGGRSVLPIIIGAILTFSLLGNARQLRIHPIRVAAQPQVINPPAVALQQTYRGGVNMMNFDLSAMPVAELDRTITIYGSVDNLLVTVPPGVAVQVESGAEVSRLTLCGQRVERGADQNQTYDTDPYAASHLRLQLDGGAGEVRIMNCQPSLTPPTPPSNP